MRIEIALYGQKMQPRKCNLHLEHCLSSETLSAESYRRRGFALLVALASQPHAYREVMLLQSKIALRVLRITILHITKCDAQTHDQIIILLTNSSFHWSSVFSNGNLLPPWRLWSNSLERTVFPEQSVSTQIMPRRTLVDSWTSPNRACWITLSRAMDHPLHHFSKNWRGNQQLVQKMNRCYALSGISNRFHRLFLPYLWSKIRWYAAVSQRRPVHLLLPAVTRKLSANRCLGVSFGWDLQVPHIRGGTIVRKNSYQYLPFDVHPLRMLTCTKQSLGWKSLQDRKKNKEEAIALMGMMGEQDAMLGLCSRWRDGRLCFPNPCSRSLHALTTLCYYYVLLRVI